MEPNPYEAPREAGGKTPKNWKLLFFRGLWIAGGSIAALGVVVAMEPELNSAVGIALLAVAVVLGIVFHAGLLMAIVGGIGRLWSGR